MRAGYSQVTGGYDGGQAEYVRVPFGARTERAIMAGATCQSDASLIHFDIYIGA